jgi:small-conductance mechanosensitive channel
MKAVIVISILVSYFFCMTFITRVIRRIGSNKDVNIYRIRYINKIINLAITAFFFAFLLLFLGIEYSQLSVFFSSLFAIIGVALFAQWSILSNITASLIIFFFFPYRAGDQVQIINNDEDISGIIEEISLFHVIIKRDNDLITYPNSIILQRPVIKTPKDKQAPSSSDEERED